MFTKSYFMI